MAAAKCADDRQVENRRLDSRVALADLPGEFAAVAADIQDAAALREIEPVETGRRLVSAERRRVAHPLRRGINVFRRHLEAAVIAEKLEHLPRAP